MSSLYYKNTKFTKHFKYVFVTQARFSRFLDHNKAKSDRL